MQMVIHNFKRIAQFSLATIFALGLLLLLSGLSVAQQSKPQMFSSPEKASDALFAAVQSNREEVILGVLGGDKELLSTGDALDDQHDRLLFVEKYREMHRLVNEPNGTTLLYIGAENWPFPVPLVSRNGQWYFDPDAGIKEVVFRRVGENEANAIAISQSLAAVTKDSSEANTDDAAVQSAQALIDADTEGSGGGAASKPQSSQPLYGYYFRKLKSGKAGTDIFIVVAYPAEYRSSGVMTFVVATNGAVYEKDLGTRTTTLAKGMTTWKPDHSWHIVR